MTYVLELNLYNAVFLLWLPWLVMMVLLFVFSLALPPRRRSEDN